MFVVLIVGATVCFVAYVTNRHAKGGSRDDTAELQREVTGLREELDGVRQDLSELAERLDFAERMLAKQRESDRLSPPKG